MAKKNLSATVAITCIPKFLILIALFLQVHAVEISESVISDWETQDGVDLIGYRRAFTNICHRLPPETVMRLKGNVGDGLAKTSSQESLYKQAYIEARLANREQLFAPYQNKMAQVVFVKHKLHCGVTPSSMEEVEPSPNYYDRTSLCLMTLNGVDVEVETIVSSSYGVIRDPCISFDGTRILYARKNKGENYKIFEVDIASKNVRQITYGPEYADMEPVYLPTGNILFSSTRCGVKVPCTGSPVTNFYLCDKDGNYIRRIAFDQVHTSNPTLMPNGKVIYTRWEYNDRSHPFIRSLFVMNPDGAQQLEYYGNNTVYPPCIHQPRAVPGSNTTVMAIATGHHACQVGKLVFIDITKGRQDTSGLSFVNEDDWIPDGFDRYAILDHFGQYGECYAYPCPLDENACLVSYAPDFNYREVKSKRMGLYFVTRNNEKELLVDDGPVSCLQPVLLETSQPPVISSKVDYRKKTGNFYVQDIYQGLSLKGVQRGSIKKIRVVALEYRRGSAGGARWGGDLGDGSFVSPIAHPGGSWDVKHVLGEAPVYEDGSAAFVAPARLPVYFQAIDTAGSVAQTMRSWAVVQPGEDFSCVGCHEDKNEVPPPLGYTPRAMALGPRPLEPFYDLDTSGFSYEKIIQPILDKNCIECHNESHPRNIDLQN
ncbi:MAG: hypothetical protein GF350_04390, partial [Chitinivibrionales bacterium]|nr:hypothetical protein [Chitinivibrionales bacterium]